MTESQFFRCRADDMDKYIAGVSRMEQNSHIMWAELEKERENVKIMRDIAMHREEAFVMVSASLIQMSSLYREFMRCRSVEAWVHFEKTMEFIFDAMDYSSIRPFVLSHPCFLASTPSAMPTPAKSGLPIKAALAVGKNLQKIEESSKLRFFSKQLLSLNHPISPLPHHVDPTSFLASILP